jgi:hypothetical protein
LSIFFNFVTAPYAVSEISPVKLFFDNGLNGWRGLPSNRVPREIAEVLDCAEGTAKANYFPARLARLIAPVGLP